MKSEKIVMLISRVYHIYYCIEIETQDNQDIYFNCNLFH